MAVLTVYMCDVCLKRTDGKNYFKDQGWGSVKIETKKLDTHCIICDECMTQVIKFLQPGVRK